MSFLNLTFLVCIKYCFWIRRCREKKKKRRKYDFFFSVPLSFHSFMYKNKTLQKKIMIMICLAILGVILASTIGGYFGMWSREKKKKEDLLHNIDIIILSATSGTSFSFVIYVIHWILVLQTSSILGSFRKDVIHNNNNF